MFALRKSNARVQPSLSLSSFSHHHLFYHNLQPSFFSSISNSCKIPINEKRKKIEDIDIRLHRILQAIFSEYFGCSEKYISKNNKPSQSNYLASTQKIKDFEFKYNGYLSFNLSSQFSLFFFWPNINSNFEKLKKLIGVVWPTNLES